MLDTRNSNAHLRRTYKHSCPYTSARCYGNTNVDTNSDSHKHTYPHPHRFTLYYYRICRHRRFPAGKTPGATTRMTPGRKMRPLPARKIKPR